MVGEEDRVELAALGEARAQLAYPAVTTRTWRPRGRASTDTSSPRLVSRASKSVTRRPSSDTDATVDPRGSVWPSRSDAHRRAARVDHRHVAGAVMRGEHVGRAVAEPDVLARHARLPVGHLRDDLEPVVAEVAAARRAAGGRPTTRSRSGPRTA